MMRIIDLMLKDIRQLLRDWRTLFFMLIMPVGFTVMFGFIFSGVGDADEDPRLPIGYLDLDTGALSPYLLDLMNESEVIRLEDTWTNRDDLEEAVLNDDLAAAIVVPAGYSQATLGGEKLSLILLTKSGSTSAPTIQGDIQAITTRLNSALNSAQISTNIFANQVGFDDDSTRDLHLQASLTQSLEAWENPPLRVDKSHTGLASDPANEGEDAFGDNSFSHSSTGMMAQFAIAGLMAAAGLLVLERKNGTMQRLMTTSISRAEYLFGHYLTMFLMVFSQLLLLTIFGHLVLDVGYYREPFGTLLMIIVSALFSASLGLLIGSVAKKEEHVIIISLIAMFVLAGIGGAWVPLELTSESFQKVAYFTPVAWMVDGFKDIVIRGLGVSAILQALYVLFAFALGLFLLAVWRFRSL